MLILPRFSDNGARLPLSHGMPVSPARQSDPVQGTATPAVAIAGLLLILACFALLLGANLDVSPGLHGDEAWFGLRAQQILSGTNRSLHGMTAHSGALFPLIAAGSFQAFGVSVWSLRIPGVVCNVIAIGLLAWQVWRLRRRTASAILLLLLLASSVLVTAESRLGWEVTALGPLFAALLLALALRILGQDDPARTSWLEAAAFLGVATLGTYSHLIFLALVLGLFFASVACAVRFREYGARSLLFVTAAALANSAALAFVKIRLFEAKKSEPAYALLYALAIVIQAAAFPTVRQRLDERLRQTLERLGPLLGRLGPAAAIAGAAAFAAIHGVPFILTVANDVALQRVYSVSMPWPLAGASYGYALLLIGLYVTALVHLTRRKPPAGQADFFLVVLPVPVAAALSLLAHPRSIRYYILLNLALLVALAASHAYLPRARARWLLWVALGYAFAVNAALIPNIADRHHYESVAPRWFALGIRQETSAHFFPTAPVVERMRADGVRDFDTKDAVFIGLPLQFQLSIESWKASPGRKAVVDYDYSQPGGMQYRLRDEPGRAPQ